MNLSTSVSQPGPAQPAVRLAAGVLIIVLLLTWLGGLPFYIHNLETSPDSILTTLFGNAWTPQAVRAAAANVGITPAFIGWYWLGIEIAILIGFGSIGLWIFFRKKDTFGTYLSLVFILVGTRITGPVTFSLFPGLPWVFELMEYLSVYSFLAFTSLMFLFPNGRFVPKWTAWLIPAMILLAVPISNSGRDSMTAGLLGFAGYMLPFLLGIISQGYRYLHIATLQEKLQMKWAMMSFIIYLVLGLSIPLMNFNIVNHSRPPTGMEILQWMGFFSLLTIGLYLFILALANAVFRYHLYNIDIIIRRTLVYSIVTAALAVVFFGSIVLFQALFMALTGEQSQLAIAISTLAIAALFTPIRRRAQEIIDRRFYRQKYDTARLLASFNQSLRNNLNLEDLNRDLNHILQETIHPAHQYIWLRPVSHSPKTREMP